MTFRIVKVKQTKFKLFKIMAHLSVLLFVVFILVVADVKTKGVLRPSGG